MDTSMRAILTDAIRYWERRRIVYNAVLSVISITWIAATWPSMRALVTLPGATLWFVLAVLANVCYSAAYIADVPMQYSSFQSLWRRWRWVLWLTGMLFAAIVANYWIADEIVYG